MGDIIHSSMDFIRDEIQPPDEEDQHDSAKSEIGIDAVWSVSSAKPGFGVEHLRDDDFDTFWQSDGAQPHIVNIQFRKKVEVSELAIYCNFKTDESYTPQKIVVRAGTILHDLIELVQQELSEPTGWVRLQLKQPSGLTLRTNLLQLAVLANHQGGRDCHIRQIKVYGPRRDVAAAMKVPAFQNSNFAPYNMLK